MKPLQVVVGIIRDEKGNMLFQERAKPPYQGHYGLVGGKVELDEVRDKAIVREIKEETSLDVSDFKYIEVINETLMSKDKTFQVALHLYLVKVDGIASPNLSEGEVHWVDEDHFFRKKEKYIPTDWLIVDTFLNNKTFFHEILVEDKGEHYEIKSIG